ncbi:hypothetical protein MMC34_003130 [Xylographa carneopallida]|nr:hypothetical protein [Xylographa carneopallida]
MPSRRFHAKSRHGCTQCKGKRTKCDEQKPSCTKCHRAGLHCSFRTGEPAIIFVPASKLPPPSEHPFENLSSPDTDRNDYPVNSTSLPTVIATPPSEPPSHSTASSPPLSTATPSAHQDEPGFAGEERDNLRLMHHFTVEAHRLIAPSQGAIAVWRELIPQLAFEADFLLHGILAVSALHLALTRPAAHPHGADAALALRHYTTALALFRPQLDRVTARNIYALFAFSCVVPVYVFGYPHVSQFPADPLPEMLDMISVMRGCADIVGRGFHWLQASPFKHLLLQPTDPAQALAPEIDDALTGLQERNGQTTCDPALRDAYDTAIETLWESFKVADNMPGEQATALPFPVKLSAEVLLQMREGDPMALVILAHYAVILHWLERVPWMKGWGSKTIDAVGERVGEEWRAYMAWPLREARKTMTEV